MADIGRAYEFLAGVRATKPVKTEWWQDIITGAVPVAKSTLEQKQKEKVSTREKEYEFLTKALLDKDIELREGADFSALPPELQPMARIFNKLFKPRTESLSEFQKSREQRLREQFRYKMESDKAKNRIQKLLARDKNFEDAVRLYEKSKARFEETLSPADEKTKDEAWDEVIKTYQSRYPKASVFDYNVLESIQEELEKFLGIPYTKKTKVEKLERKGTGKGEVEGAW